MSSSASKILVKIMLKLLSYPSQNGGEQQNNHQR